MPGDANPVIGRGFSFDDLRLGFQFRSHRRTIARPMYNRCAC